VRTSFTRAVLCLESLNGINTEINVSNYLITITCTGNNINTASCCDGDKKKQRENMLYFSLKSQQSRISCLQGVNSIKVTGEDAGLKEGYTVTDWER